MCMCLNIIHYSEGHFLNVMLAIDLEINSAPGSSIFLNGSYAGQVDDRGYVNVSISDDVLSNGIIQLRIENDNYRSFERTIVITSNNLEALEVSLSEFNNDNYGFAFLYLSFLGGTVLILLLYFGGKKIRDRNVNRKKGLNRRNESKEGKNQELKTAKTVKFTPDTSNTSDAKYKYRYFDKYSDLEKIAEGGVAEIFVARDPLGNKVALKIMSQYLTDTDMVNKFIGEGWALQEIKKKFPESPVVTVYEYGRKDDQADGIPYIAMELVEGRSLGFFIKNNILSDHNKIEILRQLAIAIDNAHNCKVLHRDLSPDNVLIKDTSNLEIRLIDFGVARHEVHWLKGTSVGAAFGKPEYMAPEQIEGNELDYRVDYYSFGILMYALFVGKPPFTDSVMYKVFEMHINSTIPELPNSVPNGIKELINKLLEKEPERRPNNINEILNGLNYN